MTKTIGAVINGRVTPRRATLTRDVNVRIPEMVRVAGGTFSMGSARFTDTQPIRQVTLSGYAIGKYPVTNGEYLGFLQVMGEDIPKLVADPDFALHPAVNVSWNQANEYCTFLREITKTDENPSGRKFGLTTEAQWEFAARGTKGRTYPWGEGAYKGRVNFASIETTPVDALPKGQTPSGIFDMSGNVWEWVMDWYANVYNADDLVNPKGPENGIYKVLRGGSWYNSRSASLVAVYRLEYRPGLQGESIGFRLAEDLMNPESAYSRI